MAHCKIMILLLVAMMLLSFAGCGEKNEEKGDDTANDGAMISGTVSSDGWTMDYIRFGKGEKTMVILPGLSLKPICPGGEAVAQAYAMFADEYTVYLFDRRTAPPEDYTIYQMSYDTIYAMDELEIKDSVIFGASQGGMMGIVIAAERPDLASKLILGSTAARASEDMDALIGLWLDYAMKADREGLAAALADYIYSEETLAGYRDYLIQSNLDVTDEELRDFIVYASTLEDMDIRDDAAIIQCPVLILGSENDRVTGAEASRELQEITGGELFLYEEYGHGVYDEAPDFRDRMADFMAK